MNAVPCPCCGSPLHSVQSAPGEPRSYVECYSCGARGPLGPRNDPRGWLVAAIEEWNFWARGRADHAR